MNICLTNYHLQKIGNKEAENEDAFYFFPDKQRKRLFRCAIADGASEGILDGKWARILCKEYCKSSRTSRDPIRLIERAQKEWDSYLARYKAAREKKKKPFQWYEEISMQRGAFSTIVGFTLKQTKKAQEGTWRALAIGDSCLFQIREEKLLTRFPLENSSAFGNRPLLISSVSSQNNVVFSATRIASGSWQARDTFYLITDALAFWFIREIEQGHAPWEILRNFETRKSRSFKKWIRHQKENKIIRNDDVTLLIIRIVPPAEYNQI